jgi:hypothetical protein
MGKDNLESKPGKNSFIQGPIIEQPTESQLHGANALDTLARSARDAATTDSQGHLKTVDPEAQGKALSGALSLAAQLTSALEERAKKNKK